MEARFNETGDAVQLPDEVAELTREHASEVADAGELLALAAALAVVPARPDTVVVEIGTYRGHTACFMARTLQLLGRPRPVLSIDAFDLLEAQEHNVQGDYVEYHHTVRKYGLQEVCMVLSGLSHAAARLVPDRIGVLVVDGGHDYDTVRGDIQLYAPKIVPRGIMYLDDYSPTFPGVTLAADEFLTGNGDFEVLHRTRNVLARRLSKQEVVAISG